MTSSALLGTSDAKIGQTSVGSLQGVSPGRVTVTAQVAGADSPATATFDVQNLEFTRLEVSPWPFRLSVGQRLWYEIYAVGPAGRRLLGNDPELKITHKHSGGREEALGFPHVLDANVSTNGKTETVTIEWKGLESGRALFRQRRPHHGPRDSSRRCEYRSRRNLGLPGLRPPQRAARSALEFGRRGACRGQSGGRVPHIGASGPRGKPRHDGSHRPVRRPTGAGQVAGAAAHVTPSAAPRPARWGFGFCSRLTRWSSARRAIRWRSCE